MIADRLQALRIRFIDRSHGDRAVLLNAIARDEPDLDLIGSTAHRLVGGGGTIGLPEVSVAAAAVEDACDVQDIAAVRLATDRLCQVIERLPRAEPPALPR